MAREQVLAVPELLENILLFLPFLDIVSVQRTSRILRDTVNGSTSLRKNAFFATDLARGPLKFSDGSGRSGVQMASDWRRAHLKEVTIPSGQNLVDAEQTLWINPLFELRMSPSDPWPRSLSHPRSHVYLLPPLEFHLTTPLRLTNRPHSSWRQMYISDPPCTKALVGMYIEVFGRVVLFIPHFENTGHTVVEDPEGVKLGTIVDEVMRNGKLRLNYRVHHSGNEPEVVDMLQDLERSTSQTAYITHLRIHVCYA